MPRVSDFVAYFRQVRIIRHADDREAETRDSLENRNRKPSSFSDGDLNGLNDHEHRREKYPDESPIRREV